MEKVNQFKEQAEAMMADLDKTLMQVLPPQVTKPLADKKIKPSWIVAALAVLFAVMFFFVLGQSYQNCLVNMVGFIYPMYASLKAVKTKETDDDAVWLTYWVIYGFFTTFESVTDFLFHFIPLYYPIKVGFLIWCFLPQTQGSKILFAKIISPAMDRYLPQLENKAKSAMSEVSNVTRKVLDSDKAE